MPRRSHPMACVPPILGFRFLSLPCNVAAWSPLILAFWASLPWISQGFHPIPYGLRLRLGLCNAVLLVMLLCSCTPTAPHPSHLSKWNYAQSYFRNPPTHPPREPFLSLTGSMPLK